jgi:hypothetical protein
MKRLAWVSSLVAVCAVFAPGFAACGGTQQPNGFDRDSGAPGMKEAGVDAPARDSYVPVLKYDGGGETSGCGAHCSADLHDVLDCHNVVLMTCPASEGCGPGGMCVPACESAADNKSTVGCDYYSVDPATDGEADGACFAAYIANTWTGPVSLTLEYAGATIPLDNLAVIPSGSGASITYSPLPGGMLPAGQLAILFLNDSTATAEGDGVNCPAGIVAAVTAMPTSSEVTEVLNAAFHITSSAPVVAYDIFPYGGSSGYISSATLLIPTTAWGTNYLAVDSFAMSEVALPTSQPFIQIAANQDDTQVTLSPTVSIVGGTGVAPAAMGVPTTYTLQTGQVLQLKQDTELNGTPIQSNKPVGVWGGNSCMNINVTDVACDSGHQELFPINALGNEYVAVRYRPRVASMPDEAPPWRIMGAVDGTTLTYDPPTPPTGAPTTVDSGQLVMFYAPGPFVVTSQDNKHPFYMSAHMGGVEFDSMDYDTGDPEHVNIMPPQEYLQSYVFMTDPTMSNTNLVLIRSKATSGAFEDVTLDCVTGPVPGWTPVGTTGTYEYAWVDLVVDAVPQGACNNGYHTIKSTAPFGLTVWGWDEAVSYAYPAGASVQPINTVVVLPTPK